MLFFIGNEIDNCKSVSESFAVNLVFEQTITTLFLQLLGDFIFPASFLS